MRVFCATGLCDQQAAALCHARQREATLRAQLAAVAAERDAPALRAALTGKTARGSATNDINLLPAPPTVQTQMLRRARLRTRQRPATPAHAARLQRSVLRLSQRNGLWP